MKTSALGLVAVLLPVLGMVSSCRTYEIAATVENRTGAQIDLLEVDYPSASFGVDSLPAGANYHYRIQVRGNGPVKVQYTEHASYKLRKMTGPTLYEDQQGRLEIELLPEGKAEFHSSLTPQS